MTRTKLEQTYTLDATGRIRTPGQFEGERLYVPYYWALFLDGGADRDNGTVIGFDLDAEDKWMWPELGKRRRTLRLVQRDDGFVVEV